MIDGTTNAPTTAAALQTALNDVAASDPTKNHAIELPLGVDLEGNFLLPSRGAGTGEVYIGPASIFAGTFPRVATHFEQLVSEIQGQRVRHLDSAEIAAGACFLPQIKSGTYLPAISAAHGAHHYRIVGVEVGRTAANTAIIESALINTGGPYDNYTPTLADVPHHINVEHCIVKGSLLYGTRRGIYANGEWIGIRDCSIYRIWEEGADSQCISYWNSPGAISVLNCFGESGGENILGGGAGPVMDSYPADFMKDITVQWCHHTKDPTRSGIVKKNLDEHKNGARKAVKYCIFEHNTGEAQDGTSILYQCLNDSNISPPQQDISDLIFDTVKVVGGGPMMALIGRAGYDTGHGIVWPLNPTRRVHVRNLYGQDIAATLAEAAGCDGWLMQLFNGVQDLLIEHVTAEALSTGFLFNRATINGVDTYGVTNLEIRDCLVGKGVYGSLWGDGGFDGNAALAQCVNGTVNVHNNVFYARPGIDLDPVASYPVGNFYVLKDAVGFAAWVNQNPGALAAGSPYHNAATDGGDIGADVAAILAMEAAVREVSPPWLPAGGGGGEPAVLTSLALAPVSASVQTGQTTTYTVTAKDQFNASFPVPTGLTITIGNPALASAIQSGSSIIVTGLAAGTTQLSVTSGLVVSPNVSVVVQEPPPPPTQTLTSLVLQPGSVACTIPTAGVCQVGAFDQFGAPMSLPVLVYQATNARVAVFTTLSGNTLTIAPLEAGVTHLWVSSGAVVSNKITVLVSDPTGGKTHRHR